MYTVCNPKETIQNLKHALNKLDYHAGRLYRNNPEEWAHAHHAIENFKKMPVGDQSEFLGELFGNLYGAPALVGKGVSLGAKLLGEAQILEKANKLVQKFSTGAAGLAKEVFAEEAVVVTPEGVKIPIKMAAEGETAKAVAFKAMQFADEVNPAKITLTQEIGNRQPIQYQILKSYKFQ